MSGLGPTDELVGEGVRPRNDKGLDGVLSMSSTGEEEEGVDGLGEARNGE